MGRLFGTDGARGVANTELTCEMAMNIGRAAAMVLTNDSRMRPKILIGKDTRISSDMLENALAAGLCSVGADVVTLGVVPTPAVAFLIGKLKADAGIMISASHNPCEFNGIKIFSGDCPMHWRNKLKPSCWIILIRMIVPQAAELAALPVKRMR